MHSEKEFEEIEKSNEQFKKAEQVRMLIAIVFVAFLRHKTISSASRWLWLASKQKMILISKKNWKENV